jgi:enoyl-CoA hydratase
MSSKYLHLEIMDRIGVLHFNSPPANGLNLELVNELTTIVNSLKGDMGEIRSLIITSKIENIFIAGADIKMIKKYMDGPNLVADQVHFNSNLQRVINEIECLPFPVIAAINGHAMGGGLELALACDFRFMAKGKTRIGLPEVNLGLLPGAGGTQRISRLIGKSRAKDMIFNSKLFDAESALAAGIVDQIYDPESLMEKSLEYANKLKDRAGISISVVKRCIDKGLEVSLEEGLALEMEGLERLLNTNDAKEGVTAFLEKRKPFFQSK